MYTSLAIIAVFAALGWLSRLLINRWLRKLTQQTKTGLDDAIVGALDKPLVAIVFLVGVYLATIYAPLDSVLASYLLRGLSITLGLLGIYTAIAVLDALIRWYRREAASEQRDVGLASRILFLFRLGLIVAGVLIGTVIVLEFADIPTTPLTSWLSEHGWRLGLVLVLAMGAVIVIGEFAPRLVVGGLARRADEPDEEVKKRGNTLSRILVNAGQVVVLLGTAFVVLSELEIDIAPILAGVGIAGIAIGFGAQSLVKDLVAGLFIILENHYSVGDVVRIADVGGLVEDINLRRTVLRDLDGIVHVVPNGEIRVASNFTKEWSRVNLNISVAYGEDLDRVIAVINRVGKELAEDPQWAEAVLKAPQVLRVDNLGESGIDIKILGDTKPIRQWDVMGELRRRLKRVFDEEGIEIPWPHTKVYFGNMLRSAGGESQTGGQDQNKGR